MRFPNRLSVTAGVCAATALAILTANGAAHADTITGLEFLGQANFPARTVTVDGTILGGLSGIRYDAANNRYLANSDDRGNLPGVSSPPRFYSLNLNITGGAFSNGDVTFNSATTLLDNNGVPFVSLATDLESIELSRDGSSVYISDEGDANAGINPSVREFNATTGQQIRQLAPPSYYNASGAAGTTGIRNNLAFESATLTTDGLTLLTGTENALKQDGPTSASGAFSPSRLLTFNLATGQAGAEYVYNVDPVVIPPTGTNFSVGGLVEILALGPDNYLAMERSYTIGTPGTGTGYDIKLYQFSLGGATDVSGIDSLTGATYAAVQKSLLLDLSTLGIDLDNVEGVTFGPTLADGRHSLVLVADDNFSLGPINPGVDAAPQNTQFIVFAATVAAPEPSALALFAPALLPAAFLALRRRKA